mmetsp:Transcript_21824/g.68902  ORF Transcript_21824/g.68902 Transcript_21824/m.68902 type:complete len:287 (-) Transcript_21824:1184-2044(-)
MRIPPAPRTQALQGVWKAAPLPPGSCRLAVLTPGCTGSSDAALVIGIRELLAGRLQRSEPSKHQAGHHGQNASEKAEGHGCRLQELRAEGQEGRQAEASLRRQLRPALIPGPARAAGEHQQRQREDGTSAECEAGPAVSRRHVCPAVPLRRRHREQLLRLAPREFGVLVAAARPTVGRGGTRVTRHHGPELLRGGAGALVARLTNPFVRGLWVGHAGLVGVGAFPWVGVVHPLGEEPAMKGHLAAVDGRHLDQTVQQLGRKVPGRLHRVARQGRHELGHARGLGRG